MAWKDLPSLTKEELKNYSGGKTSKMRFLVDENLGPFPVEVLQSWGWDAMSAADAGLLGKPDEVILAFAFREKRFLLTQDPDFLNDQTHPMGKNFGLFHLPESSHANGGREALIHALRLINRYFAPFKNDFVGAKIAISKTGDMRARRWQPGFSEVLDTRWRVLRGKLQEWIE